MKSTFDLRVENIRLRYALEALRVERWMDRQIVAFSHERRESLPTLEEYPDALLVRILGKTAKRARLLRDRRRTGKVVGK